MLDMGFKPAVSRIVAQTPDRAPDAVLLGDARGRDRQDRRRLHPRRPPPHPGEGRARDRRHRAPLPPRRLPERQARPPGRAAARRRGRAARWSSSAPSAAPTGSSSGCAATGSRPWRCTATRASASANGRSPGSSAGEVDALIATDVAARGIDVAGITHVINFDAPGGPRLLRAPGRPHRPRRAHRDRDQLRPRRPGRRGAPDGRRPRPRPRVQRRRGQARKAIGEPRPRQAEPRKVPPPQADEVNDEPARPRQRDGPATAAGWRSARSTARRCRSRELGERRRGRASASPAGARGPPRRRWRRRRTSAAPTSAPKPAGPA